VTGELRRVKALPHWADPEALWNDDQAPALLGRSCCGGSARAVRPTLGQIGTALEVDIKGALHSPRRRSSTRHTVAASCLT